MTLADQELRAAISGAGVPPWNWQLPDVSYETVSAEWVGKNWTAWLNARPLELAVFGDMGGGKLGRVRPLWLAESTDCDNLAIGTVAHAQVGNALSAQHTRLARGGLAYGFLFYSAGPARDGNFQVAGGHAINWFVDHDRQMRFFEPGMGRMVDLNETERTSAWFGLAA